MQHIFFSWRDPTVSKLSDPDAYQFAEGNCRAVTIIITAVLRHPLSAIRLIFFSVNFALFMENLSLVPGDLGGFMTYLTSA